MDVDYSEENANEPVPRLVSSTMKGVYTMLCCFLLSVVAVVASICSMPVHTYRIG